MPMAEKYIASSTPHISNHDMDIVFVETNPTLDIVNGHRVISEAQFCGLEGNEKYFNVAVGSSALRRDISNRLIAAGCEPFSIFANSSILHDDIMLGGGATICDYVVITSNVVIGSYFQANIHSHVSHDCRIGDYVTFGPRVSCNGNVVIEDFAYIGAGAVIKQGTNDRPIVIGQGATIGMGAIVTKSVPPNKTVIGNPAVEIVI